MFILAHLIFVKSKKEKNLKFEAFTTLKLKSVIGQARMVSSPLNWSNNSIVCVKL